MTGINSSFLICLVCIKEEERKTFMEWITAIRKSVEYIEEHLKDKISA